ncbi:MAG: rhodanese-like domain-containing protein [Bdellovibrionales bacterium]|nr:rhodanese-like domain-containing protein [Bdellovibrionales bacterium]
MSNSPRVDEISPPELKSLLERGEVRLLDVRQPEEFDLVRLPGALLVPLDELPERLDEIREFFSDPKLKRVVYCRVGGRSALAIAWLNECGVGGLYNLAGGIRLYAEVVEPTLPTY